MTHHEDLLKALGVRREPELLPPVTEARFVGERIRIHYPGTGWDRLEGEITRVYSEGIYIVKPDEMPQGFEKYHEAYFRPSDLRLI